MHLLTTTEADAFAISMIGVMACGMAFVSLIFFSILRNASRRNREVEELIEEVGDGEKKRPAGVGPAKEKEAWEKDADWWKK